MSTSIDQALRQATETKLLSFGSGNLAEVAAFYRQTTDRKQALVIADSNTYQAAGKTVHSALNTNGITCQKPFVFTQPNLHATMSHVEEIIERLQNTNAFPVVVGSGTLNDMTKLAAHETKQSYLCVTTAASMDGYTAYGASILHKGSKQTFPCPAPFALLADMEIISRAPKYLNAAGYADLAAKIPAGADWLLADTLQIDPINPKAWPIVQNNLRTWLSDPIAINQADQKALANLMEGLLISGFAMQCARTSRPASGAEHQFSHLWDMQQHTHNGQQILHGYKVGIGALTTIQLYEFLLAADIQSLNPQELQANWLKTQAFDTDAQNLRPWPDLRRTMRNELKAKQISPEQLATRIISLQHNWPTLRKKLTQQLIPSTKFAQMLNDVGAPINPEQISISKQRLIASIHQAWAIRRRFTILDLIIHCNLLTKASNAVSFVTK